MLIAIALQTSSANCASLANVDQTDNENPAYEVFATNAKLNQITQTALENLESQISKEGWGPYLSQTTQDLLFGSWINFNHNYGSILPASGKERLIDELGYIRNPEEYKVKLDEIVKNLSESNPLDARDFVATLASHSYSKFDALEENVRFGALLALIIAFIIFGLNSRKPRSNFRGLKQQKETTALGNGIVKPNPQQTASEFYDAPVTLSSSLRSRLIHKYWWIVGLGFLAFWYVDSPLTVRLKYNLVGLLPVSVDYKNGMMKNICVGALAGEPLGERSCLMTFYFEKD